MNNSHNSLKRELQCTTQPIFGPDITQDEAPECFELIHRMQKDIAQLIKHDFHITTNRLCDIIRAYNLYHSIKIGKRKYPFGIKSTTPDCIRVELINTKQALVIRFDTVPGKVSILQEHGNRLMLHCFEVLENCENNNK